MEKIQLKHPEGKKAIRMDKDKYDALKHSFTDCLKSAKTASFDDLLSAVAADLANKNATIKGVLQWNLFWVTLDMEAREELKRDKTVSPHKYSF